MIRTKGSTLIVGLVAASACLMPAQAQQAAAPGVTIYGLVDTVVRHATNVSAAGASATTMEDGLFTGSRLGLRGEEALANDLRAAFTLEAGFDPSNGTSSQGTATADSGQDAASSRLFGRQAFVTLKGTWAAVSLGRQYTTAHQVAARFQAQGNPNNNAVSVFSSHHIARQDNLLRLEGKVAGVELEASRTFGEQASSSSDANGSYALAAGYSGSAFYAGAYAQQMDSRTGAEQRRIFGIGGNYRVLDSVTAYAGWMRRSAAVSPQENKVWTVGASWKITPAFVVSAQYFDDQQSGSGALEGSRRVAWISADYEFSRRSDAYVVFDQNRISGGYARPSFMGTDGEQHAMSVGLRHRF